MVWRARAVPSAPSGARSSVSARGQRFITRLFTEKGMPRAPGEGAARIEDAKTWRPPNEAP